MCACSRPSCQRSAIRLLQASSAPHSGYTSVENAIHLPSGDQTGSETPVETRVSGRASPPSSGMRYRFEPSSRLVMKSRDLPSGENTGELSLVSPRVICRAAPVARSISQMCVARFAWGRSLVVTV